MNAVIGEEVQYSLDFAGEIIDLNECIGREITISNLHRINCIKCGNITRTSFAQGYCYPCFISAPETEECVLRPELCRAHEGIARDMNFAADHCLIDHFVYLAFSGGLKVGVTRHTQIPGRWIDQGADKAIIIARTPNRYLAGSIEIALKHHLSDKTNWRLMLSGENSEDIDLINEKEKALSLLHPDFRRYSISYDEITDIYYPVREYSRKVKNINFDKTDKISDLLVGIKGQYLLFRSGQVFNIRKYGGYLVELIY
jgi:hypothetical protein